MNKSQSNPKQTNENNAINTPGAARKLCLRLVETTADLISVLERETHLVRKATSEDFSALTARKQALSITMMRDMELLKENADYIKSTAPDQVTILQEQQGQFHRSLEINHSALSAMKAVSEELLVTIANEAAKQQTGPNTYNNQAGISAPQNKKSGPISLDTRL